MSITDRNLQFGSPTTLCPKLVVAPGTITIDATSVGVFSGSNPSIKHNLGSFLMQPTSPGAQSNGLPALLGAATKACTGSNGVCRLGTGQFAMLFQDACSAIRSVELKLAVSGSGLGAMQDTTIQVVEDFTQRLNYSPSGSAGYFSGIHSPANLGPGAQVVFQILSGSGGVNVAYDPTPAVDINVIVWMDGTDRQP
jgi:hypothetical protein